MAENDNGCEVVRDGFLGELTEAALRVASRHGVRGFSVDQEIGFWNRFGDVLRRRKGRPGEALPDELADAAYEVALRQGFRDSFLDVQLDLWKALRRVTREGDWARLFFQLFCRGSDGA